MLTDNEFDLVFDCQKVFKGVMNAMAKPGTIISIDEHSSKLAEKDNVALAIAMTFMDNRSTYYVEGNEELTTEIREKTMAVKTGLENADYVIVPDTESAEGHFEQLLACAKTGTLPEPHKSATVMVCLKEFAGENKVVLEGPGINVSREITLPDAGIAWLRKRTEMKYEFPCGTDIVFYTDKGEIMAIPRTTKTGGGLVWDM